MDADGRIIPAARFMPAAHPVVTSTGVMLLATGLMSRWGITGAELVPVAEPRAP